MTRYKKELRKHGYTLECDYPWLPFHESGMVLEGVTVRFDNDYKEFVLKKWFVGGIWTTFIDANYNVQTSYFD